MSAVAELFAQGFMGSIRLAIDLVKAPFVAWASVIGNFVNDSGESRPRGRGGD